MQQSVGEIIRQVRQFRHLTQRELAGERFSKSYVSGVEHNRIRPSAEALRFFAQQLGQPDGNFTALLQQPQVAQALSVLSASALSSANGHMTRDTTIAVLHTLLEQAEVSSSSTPHTLPTLAPDVLAALPHSLQSRYSLYMGREAREKGDLAPALHAFETALSLAHVEQQAPILDEIGTCYFLQGAYHTALGYHLHALRSLSKVSSDGTAALLQVAIELHCGDDYQRLGAYRPALVHYKSARAQLSAQHDVATTGKVYAGLGSLLYATLSLSVASPAASELSFHLSPEQIEHDYQRANSFLQQGVSLYQASSDRLQEANTLLTQVSLLLDWSAWRQRMAQEQTSSTEKQASRMPSAPLLDEAEKYCRAVLLFLHEPGPEEETPPLELDSLFPTAIARLVRIAVQRARLARLEAHSIHLAYQQRAFAAHLCQLMLETLSFPSPAWEAARHVLTLSAETLEYRSPALPPLTDVPSERSERSPRNVLGLVEVFSAVGEVAEELGRVAATPAYAHDWYVQGSQYLHTALALAHSLNVKGACDPGYLARLYQRWIALLEERALASPALAEETTQELLSVLRQGFWQFQRSRPQDMNAHDEGAVS
jgi:tetratricopeptide (TPR) repeat protein